MDDHLEIELRLEGIHELLGIGVGNVSLALPAVEIVEHDSRSVPALADLRYDAIVVHNVATFQLDAGLLS